MRANSIQPLSTDESDGSALGEIDASLAYAKLRLDLLRLARQLTDKSVAEEVVQAVFRHAVQRGPAAPRDARGLPRPAYLASLVHAFIADGRLTANAAEVPAVVTRSVFSASSSAPGARGG